MISALMRSFSISFSHQGHFPVETLLTLAGLLNRLHPLQIVFLSEYEHHDIRVLLDRPGFPQIREQRSLVLALFHGAAQLGKGASTGTSSSLARALRPRVISATSWTRFGSRVAACTNCR